jgi:hypothetical protein
VAVKRTGQGAQVAEHRGAPTFKRTREQSHHPAAIAPGETAKTTKLALANWPGFHLRVMSDFPVNVELITRDCRICTRFGRHHPNLWKFQFCFLSLANS